jgi:phage terminase Nu1 subunit (DNA packaging protein)
MSNAKTKASPVEAKESGNESLLDKKEYCQSKVIASLFGVTVRRIQQLTQDGAISTVKTPQGMRYDLVATIQAYIKYLSDKANGKTKSDTVAKLEEQKLRAEIALKESQGELHRLRTEIAIGRYLSIEEIKEDYTRFFISFKKFAMSLPHKVSGRIAGFVDPVEVRQVEKDLQKETKRLLRNFVLSAEIEEKKKEEPNAKT